MSERTKNILDSNITKNILDSVRSLKIEKYAGLSYSLRRIYSMWKLTPPIGI